MKETWSYELFDLGKFIGDVVYNVTNHIGEMIDSVQNVNDIRNCGG